MFTGSDEFIANSCAAGRIEPPSPNMFNGLPNLSTDSVSELCTDGGIAAERKLLDNFGLLPAEGTHRCKVMFAVNLNDIVHFHESKVVSPWTGCPVRIRSRVNYNWLAIQV